MDRCGGAWNYFALRTDASLYDDLLIVMAGEAEAAQIQRAQQAARAALNAGR